MKKLLLFLSLFFVLLVGCEEEDVQPKENTNQELEDITNLQTQVGYLQNELTELKSSMELLNDQTRHTFDQLLFTDQKVEHIIKHLPNIQKMYGYIEEITSLNQETTLRVQFVNMIQDDNMPNNYRMEELERGNVTLSNDVLMYVLDSVYPVKIQSVDELGEKVKEHMRLFIFTLIDNKAVLITEQYLP